MHARFVFRGVLAFLAPKALKQEIFPTPWFLPHPRSENDNRICPACAFELRLSVRLLACIVPYRGDILNRRNVGNRQKKWFLDGSNGTLKQFYSV